MASCVQFMDEWRWKQGTFWNNFPAFLLMASLVAQRVKDPPIVQETQFQSPWYPLTVSLQGKCVTPDVFICFLLLKSENYVHLCIFSLFLAARKTERGSCIFLWLFMIRNFCVSLFIYFLYWVLAFHASKLKFIEETLKLSLNQPIHHI